MLEHVLKDPRTKWIMLAIALGFLWLVWRRTRPHPTKVHTCKSRKTSTACLRKGRHRVDDPECAWVSRRDGKLYQRNDDSLPSPRDRGKCVRAPPNKGVFVKLAKFTKIDNCAVLQSPTFTKLTVDPVLQKTNPDLACRRACSADANCAGVVVHHDPGTSKYICAKRTVEATKDPNITHRDHAYILWKDDADGFQELHDACNPPEVEEDSDEEEPTSKKKPKKGTRKKNPIQYCEDVQPVAVVPLKVVDGKMLAEVRAGATAPVKTCVVSTRASELVVPGIRATRYEHREQHKDTYAIQRSGVRVGPNGVVSGPVAVNVAESGKGSLGLAPRTRHGRQGIWQRSKAPVWALDYRTDPHLYLGAWPEALCGSTCKTTGLLSLNQLARFAEGALRWTALPPACRTRVKLVLNGGEKVLDEVVTVILDTTVDGVQLPASATLPTRGSATLAFMNHERRLASSAFHMGVDAHAMVVGSAWLKGAVVGFNWKKMTMSLASDMA